MIAVGGDGTLLQAAHRFRGSGMPILGINIGYLGFITSIHGDRVRQEMKRVLNASFIVSQRTALDLEIRNGRQRIEGWALNDALITRGGNPRLIGVEAHWPTPADELSLRWPHHRDANRFNRILAGCRRTNHQSRMQCAHGHTHLSAVANEPFGGSQFDRTNRDTIERQLWPG